MRARPRLNFGKISKPVGLGADRRARALFFLVVIRDGYQIYALGSEVQQSRRPHPETTKSDKNGAFEPVCSTLGGRFPRGLRRRAALIRTKRFRFFTFNEPIARRWKISRDFKMARCAPNKIFFCF